MAVDVRGVRLEERLKIKIGEAKNLPARSNSSFRDTYCVLSLDQEEIFRTSTVERTLNPFFGEEFQFEVPRGFRYLSIYVFDRDRQYKHDRVLGKVAIRHDELKIYETDHWFALGAVDADSEVQGKVNIEILFEDSLPKINNISDELIYSPTKICNLSPDKSSITSPEDFDQSQNQSFDRRKSKNKSKHITENIKFGSCSSTSSRKLLSENTSLGRSESLKTGQTFAQNSSGPSSLRIGRTSSASFCNIQENIHSKSQGSFEPFRTIEHNRESDINYSVLCENNPTLNCGIHQPDLKNKISVRILECSDLTKKNGQCDPYALVTVHYKSGKEVKRRTKAKKKTVNPKFDECFVFDLMLDNVLFRERESTSQNSYTVCPINTWSDVVQYVTVSIMHETFFLGEVKLSLQTSEDRAALNTSAWYLLGSRLGPQSLGSWQQGLLDQARGATPSGTQFSSVKSSSLGSLRLLLNHTVDRILPPPAYEKLKLLLLQPIQKQSITSSAVYILGEIVSSKGDVTQPLSKIYDVAKPLVRLFTHADSLVPVIKALAEVELSTLTDANTIFRGNTLVSKMMDEAMRLTGLAYLQNTLKKTIDLIFTEKKHCEIDPTRVKDLGTIDANLINLKDYIQKVFDSITQSFIHCPAIMCRLFDALRQCAAQRFPRDLCVQYSVVSGFIFLRFFAPAILNPRLFDLTTEQIDPQTNRTLTLISKTIQTLGNFVSSRTSQQVCKEEYMVALNKYFFTPRHVNAIKQFLEIISSSTETQNRNNIQESPILLKEGSMMKRSQKKKKFMRANMKKRYFRLTSCELTYSKGPGKNPQCTIPLAEIVGADAEPPNKQNLSMNNMFCIVHRDRPLYIQASNCVERKEWLDLLGKLCEGHRNISKRYHTESFVHGNWECCMASKQDAPGCAKVPVHSPPAGIHLRLDPARDLQRIHCLLYKNISVIDSRLQQLQHGNNTDNLNKYDDIESYKKTLKELSIVTYSLEDRHRVFQRHLDRETKYGSKQAPIGDDNYLQLASRNADSDKYLKNLRSDSLAYGTNMSIPRLPTPNVNIISANSMRFKSTQPGVYHEFKLNSDPYLTNLHIDSSSESIKDSDTLPKNKSNSTEARYLRMVPNKSDLSGLNSKPRSYSTSEYVHIKPNIPMKEDVREKSSPQNCPEYDLLSNFTSSSAKDCESNAEDVPPAIPPRNHHLTSPNPYMHKYKKPLLQPNVQNDYEHKSMEQYQLKPNKPNSDTTDSDPINNSFNEEILYNNTQSETPILSHVTRSQNLTDLCDTKRDSENQMHLDKVQKTMDAIEPDACSSSPDSEIVYRNTECKDSGFFSRRGVQRKSTPTKSKIGNKKTNSMDGGIESLDAPSSKSHQPLSDRLTPSFFKKKTKVNTDSVRLPPIC